MSTASQPRQATVEDLARIPGKAELVNGQVVLMPPTGIVRGHAALEIAISLREHARRTGVGRAVGDNVGFVVDLPHRRSFSPDAAFCQDDQNSMKFNQGAPAFAVEVRSENDYGPAAEVAMATKRRDYFAAGTQVVWDVDLLGDVPIRAYRAADPENAQEFRRRDIHADAEPAVPGWRMPIDDLFM